MKITILIVIVALFFAMAIPSIAMNQDIFKFKNGAIAANIQVDITPTEQPTGEMKPVYDISLDETIISRSSISHITPFPPSPLYINPIFSVPSDGIITITPYGQMDETIIPVWIKPPGIHILTVSS